jgi:hypothetical protein
MKLSDYIIAKEHEKINRLSDTNLSQKSRLAKIKFSPYNEIMSKKII